MSPQPRCQCPAGAAARAAGYRAALPCQLRVLRVFVHGTPAPVRPIWQDPPKNSNFPTGADSTYSAAESHQCPRLPDVAALRRTLLFRWGGAQQKRQGEGAEVGQANGGRGRSMEINESITAATGTFAASSAAQPGRSP